MQYNAKTSEYFLELLRCVLHDKTACQKPQDISWEEIFEYAKSQSLSTMAYRAIQKSGFDIGAELAQEWSARYAMNLVKHYNQEQTCESICKAFSDAGILHMPLKGSLIGKLFPAPEMREMCDLDILVKPEDLNDAHEIMLANGYSYIEDYTTSHNRDYQKRPYLNIELHFYLIPSDNRMFSYYADYWNKASFERCGLTCRMTWDDCYIYMMAHACKHYYYFLGTGIRSVLDVYVMRDRLKNELHREYIVKELKKLNILEFAERFELLAESWFAEEKTEVPSELHDYHYRLLESTTYGDNNKLRSRAMEYMQGGKSFRSAKHLVGLRMLFPPLREMRDSYTVLKKCPFLLPFVWVFRGLKTVMMHPDYIASFFGKLKKLTLPGNQKEGR